MRHPVEDPPSFPLPTSLASALSRLPVPILVPCLLRPIRISCPGSLLPPHSAHSYCMILFSSPTTSEIQSSKLFLPPSHLPCLLLLSSFFPFLRQLVGVPLSLILTLTFNPLSAGAEPTCSLSLWALLFLGCSGVAVLGLTMGLTSSLSGGATSWRVPGLHFWSIMAVAFTVYCSYWPLWTP